MGVSNENNFSAYAAFSMLYELLVNKTTGTSDPVLVEAMKDLDTIITATDKWIDTQLLPPEGSDIRVVYQGGHVGFGGVAVDCQTWGMTVVGQTRMDANYGDGMAYKIWQTTKGLAGYYTPDGKLGGVGYTDVGGNKIWSAEWTWGAIGMAKKLAYEYTQSVTRRTPTT